MKEGLGRVGSRCQSNTSYGMECRISIPNGQIVQSSAAIVGHITSAVASVDGKLL